VTRDVVACWCLHVARFRLGIDLWSPPAATLVARVRLGLGLWSPLAATLVRVSASVRVSFLWSPLAVMLVRVRVRVSVRVRSLVTTGRYAGYG
jgi:hypothetical protein